MTSGERPTSARTPGSPDATTRDELLDQAAALDNEAITYRGGGPKADALRRRAAELRVEALGPKPYPVEICSVCFRLTGWAGADGACATDLWLRGERADPDLLGTTPSSGGARPRDPT
jgi:hypothetical protein